MQRIVQVGLDADRIGVHRLALVEDALRRHLCLVGQRHPDALAEVIDRAAGQAPHFGNVMLEKAEQDRVAVGVVDIGHRMPALAAQEAQRRVHLPLAARNVELDVVGEGGLNVAELAEFIDQGGRRLQLRQMVGLEQQHFGR